MTPQQALDQTIEKAELFCKIAHEAVGQKRKYTGEHYWHHPKEVAEIVASVGGSTEMIAAAYLHDVLEDTKVSRDLVLAEFGNTVLFLVEWLTDVSKPEDGNRTTRKQIDFEHTACAPPEAKTIKLADLISNSRTIVQHDPDFARVYLKEKEKLLTVLTDGNQELYLRAMSQLTQSIEAMRRGT